MISSILDTHYGFLALTCHVAYGANISWSTHQVDVTGLVDLHIGRATMKAVNVICPIFHSNVNHAVIAPESLLQFVMTSQSQL